MAKKVNHVVVNGETIVDLRNDNVTPEAMVPGTTAHNAAGEQIAGTYVPPVTSVNGKTGAVELVASDVGALPISGGTLTGDLTGKYITGTWLRTTEVSDKAGDFATIDSDGWIYKRTASEVREDVIKGNTIMPASIELFPGESAGSGGYIDFHYNNDATDYTSRFIESPKGTIKYNNHAILSSANIIALRNVNITFTNGIGTYENSDITTASVPFVQWRAGAVATLQDSVLSTTANNGSLTIVAKNALTGGPLPMNILIINK